MRFTEISTSFSAIAFASANHRGHHMSKGLGKIEGKALEVVEAMPASCRLYAGVLRCLLPLACRNPSPHRGKTGSIVQ
jgi:hypothetical protein